MAKKKALIITYYWPPGGGSGVQRWLKFVKYLGDFGWEPIIYTPSNPEYPSEDMSLQKDIPENIAVIKRPIKEPYRLYRAFSGKKSSEKIQTGFLNESGKSSFKEIISRWLRGNLFIPDARKYWIKPSIKFLSSWLKTNPVDVIISTGPPHSMHMIALGLKQNYDNIPWVADYRDPWTGVYYFNDLKLSKAALKKHKRLEKRCLENADQIIVVGDTMKHDFEKITSTPVSVITNGFDSADYNAVKSEKAEKFNIMYTGTFLPQQNPGELWEVLREMLKSNSNFGKHLKISCIGKTDVEIIKAIEKNGLKEYLELTQYVPHKDIPQLQQKAAVLLLCLNRIENASYIITGKVFEYLASGRPILAICPEESDVAKIIKETDAGEVVPFADKKRLSESINLMFEKHTKGMLMASNKNFEQYSRYELTRSLSKLLDNII